MIDSVRKHSTLEYVLLGLLPYTRQNLLLSYKPGQFFNEPEKISGANQATLRSTLSRAQKQGLVERVQGVPRLTSSGEVRIRPYISQKITGDIYLMVLFDIPEDLASQRRKLRNFLKLRQFEQVQKSVWVTKFDYREEVVNIVDGLRLNEYVQVFEGRSVY